MADQQFEHDILTIEEVAQHLRVSERTVYDWAQKGQIPCGKIGTTWRFKRNEIERWIDQRLGGLKPQMGASSVRIGAILAPNRVVFPEVNRKKVVLDRLVAAIASAPEVRAPERLQEEITRREDLMSTGIGFGVGVPHVRIDSVDDLVMAVALCPQGIEDYESLDQEPIKVVCMIAAARDQHGKYIRTLAAISRLLKHPAFRERLLDCTTPDKAYELLVTEGE